MVDALVGLAFARLATARDRLCLFFEIPVLRRPVGLYGDAYGLLSPKLIDDGCVDRKGIAVGSAAWLEAFWAVRQSGDQGADLAVPGKGAVVRALRLVV